MSLITIRLRMRIKSYVFRNMRPCGPYNISRQFGGKHLLHLQSRRIKINRREGVIRHKVTNCSLETLEKFTKKLRDGRPLPPGRCVVLILLEAA
jgi:hypothetical protein